MMIIVMMMIISSSLLQFKLKTSKIYDFILSNKRNMESLEKIILPPIEVTKCTTRLALNKLSLDCCPYVFVTLKMTINVLKQTVWNISRQTAHVNNIRLNFSTFYKRIVLKNKSCYVYIQEHPDVPNIYVHM